MKKFDIIVVGAGPAGTTAARAAAEKGVSVLVLEKNRDIGAPVRCGEGVSETGLKSVLNIVIDESWIAQIITGVRFFLPDGRDIEYRIDERGLILHRKIFDAALGELASRSGAVIMTKAFVKGLLVKDGYITGVRVNRLGEEYDIESSVVIGADGIELRVGTWAGLIKKIKPHYMIPCIQMTLTDIDIDPEIVEFYLGSDVAPGEYLWVFPKGKRTANVGLSISPEYNKEKNALSYLNDFIGRKFPFSSCLSMTAGGVISATSLKKIVANGLMLAGDAAFQINPLTGAGIINGMIGGRIAGDIAAKAVKKGDFSEKYLSEYQRKWHKEEGKNCDRSYKIKKVFEKFKDEDFNKIGARLSKISSSRMNAVRIIKTVLFHYPQLIFDANKVFGGK